MSWPEYSLGDIGYLSRGRSRHRPRNDPRLYGGEYPFIQTGDVTHANFYVTEHSQTYNEEGLEQSRLWPKGTLCITIAANIAETALLSYEACFPDSIIGFISYPDKCDARYIKFYFDLAKAKFKQVAQGAAQDNLSQEKLLSFRLPLPPVAIQQEIASVLSTYNDLIENNTRRIALLEESMRLLYREWFVRLRFPGHEAAKLVDGLPEGWEKKPLEQICDLTMGQSPPSDTYNQDGDGLPFHQGVTRFGGRFVTHDTFCTQANRVAEPGDILFSVRAPVGRINITLDKVVIGRGLSAMRCKTGHQSFLFYQLKSHFFKEDMLGGGAIFASVTKQQLSSEMLLAPKLSVVDEFGSIAKPVDQQIVNLHMQNQRLTEARDLLLPRLMSGEIEV